MCIWVEQNRQRTKENMEMRANLTFQKSVQLALLKVTGINIFRWEKKLVDIEKERVKKIEMGIEIEQGR